MKKTLLFLAAFVLSVSVLPAAEEAAVRVYVLKHKRVEEAALLIRPHLSDSASITLIQKMNARTPVTISAAKRKNAIFHLFTGIPPQNTHSPPDSLFKPHRDRDSMILSVMRL